MRARAPASSANLGPGFDTLALALALYVEVEVTEAPALEIVTEGEGSDLPADTSHLAVRVVRQVRRALGRSDTARISVRSEIPVARGLGSSAALAAAAAAAAGAEDPLDVASETDGHPENAAASVRGGLVAATMVSGVAVVNPLPLDPDLAFVVVVPDLELSTAAARAALPSAVPHGDAVFNLGRMGLLLAGLADHRALVSEATGDRLHQPYRTPLFPQSEQLIDGLLEAGARAACWSGAGSSLLAMCSTGDGDTGAVREAGERLLSEARLTGRCLLLPADREGLVTSD